MQRTERACNSAIASAVVIDVTTGTRSNEPAADRTTLAAVTSTVPRAGEHRARAGGVRDAHDRADVARVGHAVEHDRGPAVERDVVDGRRSPRDDRHRRLRRHGARDAVEGLRVEHVDRNRRRRSDPAAPAPTRRSDDRRRARRSTRRAAPAGLRRCPCTASTTMQPSSSRASRRRWRRRSRADVAVGRGDFDHSDSRSEGRSGRCAQAALALTAARATDTNSLNAAASATAISARILRSTSTPASLSPLMNTL